MIAGRTATVFGGTGFLGHAVVQALVAQGYHVRVPTRDLDKAHDMKLMGSVGQVLPVRVSVRQDASIAEVIQGSDLVINLIGELAEKKKNGFQLAHVETAARLARLAKADGVPQFVHLSALGANTQSASRYARTKALGEEAVRTFFPSAVILRPSVMFGPRDRFFNRFALIARFLPFLPLIGGGHTKFQPVYVGDVASFLIAAVDRADTRGRVFELGGPQIYTFRELLSLLLSTMGLRRYLLSISWKFAAFKALFLERFPEPLLTRDQVELLKVDNVVGKRAKGVGTMETLGLTPTKMEDVLPSYIG